MVATVVGLFEVVLGISCIAVCMSLHDSADLTVPFSDFNVFRIGILFFFSLILHFVF